MRSDRGWMYKRLDGGFLSLEFVRGVDEFIKFACETEKFKKFPKLRCPCVKCQNVPFLDVDTIKWHLYKHGFLPNYSQWVCQGENCLDSITPSTESLSLELESNPYRDMVMDALCPRVDDFGKGTLNDIEEDPNPEAKKFFSMLSSAKEPLYDGCNLSILSVASRLTNIKCEYNVAHRCLDSIASLMKDMCPVENNMSESYYKTRKLLEGLELPHQRIDACPNGCMLFWKGDEQLDKCRKCNIDRYRQKNIPNKVLIYFPITPRLQRIYATKGIANQMRWHSENPRINGSMAHPCDGEAWKHFDATYPDFAADPRNIRLGLCTDGFSPFGKFGKTYSCWPVILTPYNLPPWLCMKRPFMFLSLIIPGPRSPKGNLDVYLQPLIDEMKTLWDVGALTYDVSKMQNFTMRAAIIWTISDFPAYGMLSGWSTGGKLACPYCMEKTKSFYLEHGSKICWFDCHRQFLPRDHIFRKNRSGFTKNRVEHSEPPQRLTGDQIWECVSSLPKVTDPTFSIQKNKNKKKGGWTRQSIFWELPYWNKLLIRHNLDVMHIEKNVFDQIIHTVMEVKDKTKDTISARRDLPKYCKRRKLHLRDDGENVEDSIPKAPFVLTKEQKRVLCEWIQKLKFPDGYASNLGRCVDLKHYKLSGMKSHDCHVFMERLLPIALRELLPSNVWKAITELSQFFRDICSSLLRVDDMIRLEQNIPEILCKLEKIFPPAFFNCMEHLPVHLPYEAKVGGPVHYRWMYPFERFLHHLKRKVSNKAHVEGSICNAYLTEEISNFCTHYFEPQIDTKARDLGRNVEGVDETLDPNIPEVFSQNDGHATKKGKTIYLDDRDYRAAHGYVLSNCEVLREYERIFEREMIRTHPRITVNDVWSKFDHEFPMWFKQYVLRLNIKDDMVKTLACGPLRQVQTWKHYYTNGFNFHTYEYGKNKSTANYGVCVKAHDGLEYYGILQEVIELVYHGATTSYKTILFKCDWMNPGKGTNVHEQYKFVEVNHTMKYPKYDPFVLAFQVQQVYFAPYPSTKKDKNQWWAVFKVKPRSTIDVPIEKMAFQEEVIESPSSLCQLEEEKGGENQYDEEDTDKNAEQDEEHEEETTTIDDDIDDDDDDHHHHHHQYEIDSFSSDDQNNENDEENDDE